MTEIPEVKKPKKPKKTPKGAGKSKAGRPTIGSARMACDSYSIDKKRLLALQHRADSFSQSRASLVRLGIELILSMPAEELKNLL